MKHLRLASGLIVLTLILAACGGSLSESDAEAAITDAFNGNIEEANEHICDAEQLSSTDVSAMADVDLSRVSCQENGDTMDCSYTILFEGVESEMQTNFRIEDGKLCSSLDVSVEPSVIDDVPNVEPTVEQDVTGADADMEEVVPEDEMMNETPSPTP